MVAGRLWAANVLNHMTIGDGLDLDGVLEQAQEQQSAVVRSAPIEAEDEFIKVVVEVFVAHSAVMGTAQPTLQQRDGQMD